MKLVVAVIRPERLKEVEDDLAAHAASVLSAVPVRPTRTRARKPLLRLEVLVRDEALTESVLTTLGAPGSQPDPGRPDGVIFVAPIDDSRATVTGTR
jgi:nitrogen regulatory protein PII